MCIGTMAAVSRLGALTRRLPSSQDIHNAGTPLEQWDALPTLGKLQIFGAISFLEIMGEASYLTEAQGQKHYMMGGKPGFFPSIKNAGIPHPVRAPSSHHRVVMRSPFHRVVGAT